MGVQIVENWSLISGLVAYYQEQSELRGFAKVEIMVEKVEPVEGYTDLLSKRIERNLEVHMPQELVREYAIQPRAFIQCRVRLATIGRVFVHREHLFVLPPGER